MTDPIVVERFISAPAGVVYSYLTSAEKWARWQGSDHVVDPVPGGALTLAMPNGEKARGEFVELMPPTRLVFTWGWEGHPTVPPGSSIVEIELIERAGGTVLRLTHRGLPPEELPLHESGWLHYTARLAAVAEGGDPGPDLSTAATE